MSQHICPVCASAKYIEVNLHSDGFTARPIEECGACGAVWTYVKGLVSLISTKTFEDYIKPMDYTKYASFSDEFVAEDQKVWFS